MKMENEKIENNQELEQKTTTRDLINMLQFFLDVTEEYVKDNKPKANDQSSALILALDLLREHVVVNSKEGVLDLKGLTDDHKNQVRSAINNVSTVFDSAM